MKKNFIKHSSVVVAALLAAASVGAATGTVKADVTQGHFVQLPGHQEYPTQGVNGYIYSNKYQPTYTIARTATQGEASVESVEGANQAAGPVNSDKKADNSTGNTPTSGTQAGTQTPTTPATTTPSDNNGQTAGTSNTNTGSTTGNTTNGQITTGNTSNTTQGTTNGSTTATGTPATTNGTQNTTNSNTTANTNNNSSATNTSTSTSQQPADNNSNSTTETTSTSTTSAAKPVVRIAQRSYVYTKSGKIARKNGKRVVLKKSSTRSLSNAKLVTIKGQKYYQIGKNQYVKASNVIAPIRKANVRAVVKGRKNARVRAYTSTGKRTRSYLSGRKSYKFTARRSINGRTYYKVSGKNLWIPASKLNIR